MKALIITIALAVGCGPTPIAKQPTISNPPGPRPPLLPHQCPSDIVGSCGQPEQTR